jgi:hypothetical protein
MAQGLGKRKPSMDWRVSANVRIAHASGLGRSTTGSGLVVDEIDLVVAGDAANPRPRASVSATNDRENDMTRMGRVVEYHLLSAA